MYTKIHIWKRFTLALFLISLFHFNVVRQNQEETYHLGVRRGDWVEYVVKGDYYDEDITTSVMFKDNQWEHEETIRKGDKLRFEVVDIYTEEISETELLPTPFVGIVIEQEEKMVKVERAVCRIYLNGKKIGDRVLMESFTIPPPGHFYLYIFYPIEQDYWNIVEETIKKYNYRADTKMIVGAYSVSINSEYTSDLWDYSHVLLVDKTCGVTLEEKVRAVNKGFVEQVGLFEYGLHLALIDTNIEGATPVEKIPWYARFWYVFPIIGITTAVFIVIKYSKRK